MPPFLGEIRLGDLFEWCPYGSDGWPHAYEQVRVVKIVSYGEEMPFTKANDDLPEAKAVVWTEDRKGNVTWNDLSRFREACRKITP